jgi:ABC-type glycerol-3-phosphate transport system substrate-binding protein
MFNAIFPSLEPSHSRRVNLTAYSTILLALLLALSLGACSRTPTQTPPTAEITPAPEKTTTQTPVPTATQTPIPTISIDVDPEELQGIRVELWHPWSGRIAATVSALVRAFNSENNYGITVEAVSLGNYNDLYSEVESAIQTGAPPHLAVGYNYIIQSWNTSSARVIDLTPYVNDAEWGLVPEEQASFYPLIWEQDVVADVRLGLPAQRFAQLLYYNQTWARQLGFSTAPVTPEDFRRQACAAALANNADNDPENNGTGGWVVNTNPQTILSWMYAFDSDIIQSNRSGYRFNTPQTQNTLEYLRRLYDNGCAWLMLSDYAEPHFAARRALFVSGSLADLPYFSAALEEAGNQDDWTVLGFPTPEQVPVVDVYGPAYAMFASTPEEQLAAWTFLHWLLKPENQARFIEASGTLPLGTSAMDHLQEYAQEHPQWAAAADLINNARSEPDLLSWSVVRWTLGDVGTQVFRSYFTTDYITDTLTLLDETANELHRQFLKTDE